MTDSPPTGRPDLDLDACATEPIHVPGTIQPHGVLLAVDEPDLRLVRASANAPAFLGRDLDRLLGARLPDVVGGMGTTGMTDEELWTTNPRPVSIASGDADAVVHRTGGLQLVELEPAGDREQVAQATSFRRLRGALEQLQSATTLEDLVAVTAREVSTLTSFDRVMVYHFDEDWNGEVVAEERAPGLEPFLGLRYPASDIPAQARALYTTNWQRLIVDRAYDPVPILPTATGADGLPLDLSAAALRSVSPVHLGYLANMGVVASMSISLLEGGELWGLIACHHYSGPYRPPQPVRAAAELLARTVSLVLPTVVEGERRRRAAAVRDVENRLVDRLDATQDVAEALTTGTDLLALTRSTGAAIKIDGRISTTGMTPPPEALEAIARAVLRTADDECVGAADALVELDPALSEWAGIAAGAVVTTIGERDGDWLIWTRPEVVQTVTWGGDPRSKVVREDAKISPRRSFDAWTETVAGRCEPWHADDSDAVDRLGRHIGRVLLRRAQLGAHVAAALKRTLLVETLPSIPAPSPLSATAPTRAIWWEVTGTTCSGSPTGVSPSRSATSPVTVWRRRLSWRTFATHFAPTC